MAHQIADMLRRSSASLPKWMTVENHRVGSWPIDDVCEALVILSRDGVIDGFDADSVYDSGDGRIRLWAKGEHVLQAA